MVVAADGLFSRYVGDTGQGVPLVTHVTKNAGSPAGGTLSIPGTHVTCSVLLSDPDFLSTEEMIGAVADDGGGGDGGGGDGGGGDGGGGDGGGGDGGGGDKGGGDGGGSDEGGGDGGGGDKGSGDGVQPVTTDAPDVANADTSSTDRLCMEHE